MHFEFRPLLKALQQRLGRGAEMRDRRAVVPLHVAIVGGQKGDFYFQSFNSNLPD